MTFQCMSCSPNGAPNEKRACLMCADGTDNERLLNGYKENYKEHRHWLDDDHPFRFMTRLFNGNETISHPINQYMDGIVCWGCIFGLIRLKSLTKMANAP